MEGNTWEWTNDQYCAYSAADQTDPQGPKISQVDSAFYKFQPKNPDKKYAVATGHVSRGADVFNPAVNLECAYRGGTWGLVTVASLRMVRRP